MVAGAGGDHPLGQYRWGKTHHLVEGAPELEAEDRLQVFPLQQHPVTQPFREVGGLIER